eukprot:6208480-Pleurochrysis_carterae.AAC.1
MSSSLDPIVTDDVQHSRKGSVTGGIFVPARLANQGREFPEFRQQGRQAAYEHAGEQLQEALAIDVSERRVEGNQLHRLGNECRNLGEHEEA